MKPINPAAVAASWAQNLGNASQKYSAGVQAVTSSPMAAAAANPQKYLNGVQNAVQSGKWAAKLNAVSLQTWQQQCVQVGAARLSTGAQAAKTKVQAFWTTFGPMLQTVTDQVRQMPSTTVQDRINRAVAQMTGVHAAAVAAGMGKA